jgi:VCBS repeat-containing protein
MTGKRGILLYDFLANRGSVSMVKNNIVSTVGEAVRLEFIDHVSMDHNILKGQTNAVNIKGSNVKVSATNDIESVTSDAFVIWGSSVNVKVEGVTIRDAGRYAFNISESSKAIKILNNFINGVKGVAVFNVDGPTTKNISIKGNHIESATNIVNVIIAKSTVDRLYFNDNVYPASIVSPIANSATNSDVTGNKTF